MYNLNRGKYWCEFGEYVKNHRLLNDTDFLFVNGLDLGMARSHNVFAARRIGYSLNMNYCFAGEVYEGTKGSTYEQETVGMMLDEWGIHGMAMYTKFLVKSASVETFPDKEEFVDLGLVVCCLFCFLVMFLQQRRDAVWVEDGIVCDGRSTSKCTQSNGCDDGGVEAGWCKR